MTGDGAALHRHATRMAPSEDHLRLMTKVARMYYQRGLRQSQIATELHISQARSPACSSRPPSWGIVRTIIPPPGVHTDLEEEIQGRYQLRDVIVVDADFAGDDVVPALGAAAAVYLETTLTGGERMGISIWSTAVLATVEAMHLRKRNGRVVEEVVQLIGGVGNPAVQVRATRLTGRLAELTGARPVFMATPGLVSTAATRKALMSDVMVNEVMTGWDQLTMAVVGIGSLEDPSPLLRQSGNALTADEQERLRALGAVGDICLRFFDERGQLVPSTVDTRVVGIAPDQLCKIDRRVGVAGGRRKFSAIRAAPRGNWVNVLITSLDVARRLVEQPEEISYRGLVS
jgi:DNA-binding transcriptional regulator LsrR (DeoR family)